MSRQVILSPRPRRKRGAGGVFSFKFSVFSCSGENVRWCSRTMAHQPASAPRSMTLLLHWGRQLGRQQYGKTIPVLGRYKEDMRSRLTIGLPTGKRTEKAGRFFYTGRIAWASAVTGVFGVPPFPPRGVRSPSSLKPPVHALWSGTRSRLSFAAVSISTISVNPIFPASSLAESKGAAPRSRRILTTSL